MQERLNADGLDNEWYTTRNHYWKTGYGIQQNNGNCTAYAHGRVQEICQSEIPYSRGNAISFASKSFLHKVETPTFGAFAVWGGSYTGHVAVVEHVYENGDVLISESSWHDFQFRTQRLTKASNNQNGYLPFVGFYLYDGVTQAVEAEKERIEKEKKEVQKKVQQKIQEQLVDIGYAPKIENPMLDFTGGADSLILAGTIGLQCFKKTGAKFLSRFNCHNYKERR